MNQNYATKKVANFMKFATFALYLSFQSLERAKEICYISPNIIPFIIRFTLIFYLFFHSLFIGFILSRTTNIQHKMAFVKSLMDFNRLLSGIYERLCYFSGITSFSQAIALRVRG